MYEGDKSSFCFIFNINKKKKSLKVIEIIHLSEEKKKKKRGVISLFNGKTLYICPVSKGRGERKRKLGNEDQMIF